MGDQTAIGGRMNVAGLQQSEKQFERAVVEYAEHHGWKTAHFNDSRREVVDKRTGERKLIGDKDAKGFPDRIFARRARIVIVELKAEKGRLSKEQREWIVELGGEPDGSISQLELLMEFTTGKWPSMQVRVWRPSDWPEIERVLA
jgi:hypothetical protein